MVQTYDFLITTKFTFTSSYILTNIYFSEPLELNLDVLNMKWDRSIENLGMQYLFWLYSYRYLFIDHICNLCRITILHIYKLLKIVKWGTIGKDF